VTPRGLAVAPAAAAFQRLEDRVLGTNIALHFQDQRFG